MITFDLYPEPARAMSVRGKDPDDPEIEIEAAWAAEARRRWEAYLRGQEEMLPFDEVMAEIRSRHTPMDSAEQP